MRSGRTALFGIVLAIASTLSSGAGAESAALERDAGSGADARSSDTDGGEAETQRATVDRAIELDREGKPVEAARLLAAMLEAARATHDADPEIDRARIASNHALARVAKVRFDVPKDAFDLQLEVDGRPVVRASEGKTYSIDPGPHRVVASAVRGAVRVGLDETFVVAPLEVHTVWLGRMSEQAGACPCGPLPPCLSDARTDAEVHRCIETGRVRPGCGGCGASPDDPVGHVWPLFPLVLGWLVCRRRLAHQRSTSGA